ncbi:MAG: GGDEF domain-containing protein [Enterobacterales bacterium]|nr:GGDEF domain-containing protein [Enterobacterales bacterium]
MSELRSQWIKRAGLKSRKALMWLRDHRLPADPICYTVAYEYLHTKSPQLIQKINQLDINALDYRQKIHWIYYQCIKPAEFNKLALSSDVCNQYVCEILQILLTSGDKINSNETIITSIKEEVESNDTEATNEIDEDDIELVSDNLEVENDYLLLAETATKDSLTNALDFDGLEYCLDAAVQNSELLPMTLLRLNIDHFKDLNERSGQFMGDAALKSLVKTVNKHLKGSDLLCRDHDDEFIIALPNTSICHSAPS